jgi:hypothetical protein
MQTRLYDPAEVTVVFGVDEIKGFVDGTFIKGERNEDTFALKVGADGEGTRTRNLNRAGRLTVTIMQTSASNRVLSALAAADEASTNGASVLPLLVKNNIGKSLFMAGEAWIVKQPGPEYGKEPTGREWVFESPNVSIFEGGA